MFKIKFPFLKSTAQNWSQISCAIGRKG